MENIIRKSIEGGYDNDATRDLLTDFGKKIYARYDTYCMIFCDHLFWQALGKACGWDKTKIWLNPYTPKGRYIPSMNVDRWIQEAMNFHEINLTQGWDKAVEYLEDLIK